MSWHPVTPQIPCLVCHKSARGYCMYSDKGEFLCMRIESRYPLTLKTGEVGWVHTVIRAPTPPKAEKTRPQVAINSGKLMREWHDETKGTQVEQLAELLSVSQSSLRSLGCTWSKKYHAWAIPNFDGWGNMVGISLRSPSGFKWMVPGSHVGLFMPQQTDERLALICEGASDTAAGLTLGFFCVGRHNCASGMSDIPTAFRRLRVTSAVIISDNDEVGSRGGLALQRHLRIRSALIVLPAKDLRSFVQLGGTRELLDSMINNLVWEAR